MCHMLYLMHVRCYVQRDAYHVTCDVYCVTFDTCRVYSGMSCVFFGAVL